MKTNIQRLHEADLLIVKEVLRICDKYGLIYYMLGGTMLGAIRHKGFIPWDDDMDLGMPRKDYDKFLEVAQKELGKNLKVVNYKTDPDYHYYITRIQDMETKVVEIRYEKNGEFTHVSIDIFPLDGSPNNRLCRKWYCFRLMAHRAMISLHYKDGIDPDRKRSLKERVMLSVLRKLPTDKMFNAYNQKEKCDKLLRKYDMQGSLYTGNMMGAYRTRELVPTSWYGKDSFYQFENLRLRGLMEYDKYLSHLYGDYMRIPPEGSRKIHFKIIEIHGEKVD